MVKLLVENNSSFDLPQYAHEGDSGMDVKANISEPIILRSLERCIIPTGLKVVIPEGYEIQVRSRSGMVAKRGLVVGNSPGTVDACFRGEIGVILINLSNEPQVIEPGERIAQMILMPYVEMQFKEMEELSETKRGNGGFGSTGV